MGRFVDCIVVGGGVAGLSTALRLAQAGMTVTVVEENQLGAGASTGNQGVLHSGALYSLSHPRMIKTCLEAVKAISMSFPDAISYSGGSWYLASLERFRALQRMWSQIGFPYSRLTSTELARFVRGDLIPRVGGARVFDKVIDTRLFVVNLAAHCLASRVQFVTTTRIQSVECASNGVRGVVTDSGELLAAERVVICAGLGSRRLLACAHLKSGTRLKSRLGVVVAFPNKSVEHPIMCSNHGGPAIVPTREGYVLATRLGLPQRWTDARNPSPQNPSSAAEAKEIASALRGLLSPGIVDWDIGKVWTCTKTEGVNGHVNVSGVEPNVMVIDHEREDNIRGLWTMLPGKMTLVLHASRQLTEGMLRRPVELMISRHASLPPTIFSDAMQMVVPSRTDSTNFQEIGMSDEMKGQSEWLEDSA